MQLPVIVGIDPGTTTGLALFRLDGGLEKIVSSFSSGVIVPDRPWGWKDKRRIVESLLKRLEPGERPWRNRHERDALVAGFSAWKKLRPRMLKMERKGGLDPEALRRSLGAGERV